MQRTSGDDIAELRADGGAPAARASLWAWRVHNEVNARLALEEAAGGGGDDAFPKRAWPQPDVCPRCVCSRGVRCARAAAGAPDNGSWDEAAVEEFLGRFYGATPGDAQAAASWDPFGLAAAEEAGAERAARKRAKHAHRERPSGGRALDVHDAEAPTLRMHAAPGGLSPLAFILLCAAAPVAVYACCVAVVQRPRAGGKPARSLLARFLPRLVRCVCSCLLRCAGADTCVRLRSAVACGGREDGPAQRQGGVTSSAEGGTAGALRLPASALFPKPHACCGAHSGSAFVPSGCGAAGRRPRTQSKRGAIAAREFVGRRALPCGAASLEAREQSNSVSAYTPAASERHGRLLTRNAFASAGSRARGTSVYLILKRVDTFYASFSALAALHSRLWRFQSCLMCSGQQ
jgi:hypothetical protein